ncbi:Mss4-like protein [Poronia punctata]|nr:Mss4-like protein [Poronia punctata]
MAASTEILEIVASCLCGAHEFKAHVPHAELPFDVPYCHCNSCRHVTGAMYSSSVPWRGDGAAIRESSLRRYAFADHLTLFSCRTCSSTMFWEMSARENGTVSYGALTGVLPNVDVPALVRITDHIFVGDTLDGGAVPWLAHVNADGHLPRLWRGHKDQSERIVLADLLQPSVENTNVDRPDATALAAGEIPVRCHCGGVDLVLRSPIAEYAAKPRSELPWFVDPTSNKSYGGFDACDSCRLSSGIDVFHWTFALVRHFAFPHSGKDTQSSSSFPQSSLELKEALAATERDPRWGTLTFYESSSGVQRFFCGRCSACAFYATDDRSEMVDLAIGLLEAQDGSRAEGLISWDFGGKMVWKQDVRGGWRQDFVERMENAAERWRAQRGYPKSWLRIRKENAAKQEGQT